MSAVVPELSDLLPHRGRMLLLDRIVSIDNDHAAAETVVGEGWPLAQDGAVPGLVLVEVMAQVAGAVCALRLENEGNKPAGGFLAGVRQADLPPEGVVVGERLRVRATIDFWAGTYAVLTGVTETTAGVVATAEIQLVSA